MRVDPGQLGHAHAHPGRLLRHLDREQLLDREHERELVDLERDVVDPLGVRDALPPGLLLHRLLEARVQVADHGRDAGDHARRRGRRRGAARRASRVVRPEVDREDVVERRARSGRPGARSESGSGSASPRRPWPSRSIDRHRLLLPREPDRLAADRVVLAQAGGPPSRPPSGSARGSGGRGRRSRTCPRPRARTSRPSARPAMTVSISSPSSSHACTRTRTGSSASRSRW